MSNFVVVTSDEAMEDADQVYDYICDQFFIHRVMPQKMIK